MLVLYMLANSMLCCYSRGLSAVCMYSVIFVDPILVIKMMLEAKEREAKELSCCHGKKARMNERLHEKLNVNV